tara:strand:- start:4346 stop:4639 length:294 start_codon:yes stop_codon:yes gene_type:complete
MSIKTVERQLRRNSQQIAHTQAELGVLDEQLEHFKDEAETARIHSLVSETPISERTHQRAARHLMAIGKQREHLVERLLQLEGHQNSLLDQMGRDFN